MQTITFSKWELLALFDAAGQMKDEANDYWMNDDGEPDSKTVNAFNRGLNKLGAALKAEIK